MGSSFILLALAQLGSLPITSQLPNVSSITPANAAGVLQYCVKKDLVSSTVTDSLIEQIVTNKAVTSSNDYLSGMAGQITAGGKNFSLPNANSYLRSQACDLVLRQAQVLKAGKKP